MTTDPSKPEQPERTGRAYPSPDELRSELRLSWVQRRRDKIRNEIERNRRGEYTVPTWVLVLALVLIIAAWVAIVVFS